MEPFNFTLSNSSTVAGIRCIPPRVASPLQYRPLIVGLHGSTYDCKYFDVDAKHTASIASNAFGVPFVSIDRPCYGGTGSFLPVPKDSDFGKETGLWLHRYILPLLWAEIGVPNDCSCVVFLSHSLGCMGAIVAAAMHAQDDKPSYPLGGVILAGLADQLLPEMQGNPLPGPNHPPEHAVFPREIKDSLMFRPGTVHPDVLDHTERLSHPAPFAELESLRNVWLPTWRETWAANVEAPVMFGLAEQDCFFVGTMDHVMDCVAAFSKSVRAEGSLIRHAPHCMELSFWSQGWYARSFGFAMECAASHHHRS